MSDDPRGFRNGLWLRRLFALLDAFAVSPALLLAFCFGRRRRPVTLLRLPSRPLPRRLPTFCAAIALARRHRTKTPLTAFQQTGARPRPAARAFAAAVLLHWGEMSRILNRAHGRVWLPASSCPGGDGYPLRGAAAPVHCELKTLSHQLGWWRLVFRFALLSGPWSRVGSFVKAERSEPEGLP